MGLRVPQWLQFLAVLRELAAALGITARDAERALFDLHRRRQRGTLYRS